jgi:hypothetical protein
MFIFSFLIIIATVFFLLFYSIRSDFSDLFYIFITSLYEFIYDWPGRK